MCDVRICSGWLVDGGDVGHDCDELYRRLSIVFAGVTSTRRLCTPLMDLTHVGSLHFWFSFGNSVSYFFEVNIISLSYIEILWVLFSCFVEIIVVAAVVACMPAMLCKTDIVFLLVMCLQLYMSFCAKK